MGFGSGSTTGRGRDAAGVVDGTLRTGPPDAGLLGGAVVPFGGPLGAFAAAVVLGSAFVAWEARAAHPMLPLSLFRDRGWNVFDAT